jgi:hypothetical protein
MKQKAVKKVQVAIDKMMDLQDMDIDEGTRSAVIRVLESLRSLENRIDAAKVRNGQLIYSY